MLPTSPPLGQSPVIRIGMAGWPVFALQDALGGLARDGAFGPMTERATKSFQAAEKLTADGIAGPITQGRLVVKECAAVESARSSQKMPKGMTRGFALSEGGLMLAPVNWAIAAGVDCGPMQYRVYGPPYDKTALMQAFSAASIEDAADDFIRRRNEYLAFPWVKKQSDPYQAAGRCAALAHNWRAGGSISYATYGHVSNPDGACTWLPRDENGKLYIRFPDGQLVVTRRDWAEFYAIGGAHGPGMTTRFVTAWQ